MKTVKETWENNARRWRMYYLVTRPDHRGRRHLLYVGITSQGVNSEGILKRWVGDGGHNKTKEWWHLVDANHSRTLTVEWPPYERGIAEHYEAQEIARLKPSRNIAGSTGKPLLGYPVWQDSKRSTPNYAPPGTETSKTTAEQVLLMVLLVAAFFVLVTLLG